MGTCKSNGVIQTICNASGKAIKTQYTSRTSHARIAVDPFCVYTDGKTYERTYCLDRGKTIKRVPAEEMTISFTTEGVFLNFR